MKKRKQISGSLIIASAIIWGVIIYASASALKDTICYDKIKMILVGGVIAHMLIIWAPMAFYFKQFEKEESKEL